MQSRKGFFFAVISSFSLKALKKYMITGLLKEIGENTSTTSNLISVWALTSKENSTDTQTFGTCQFISRRTRIIRGGCSNSILYT